MLLGSGFLPWEMLSPEMGCVLVDQGQRDGDFVSSPWVLALLSSKALVWQLMTQMAMFSHQSSPIRGNVRVIKEL